MMGTRGLDPPGVNTQPLLTEVAGDEFHEGYKT